MKKMIIALAVAAMAVAAQADLVTTFPSAGVAAGGNMSYAMLDTGWYTNNLSAQNWNVAGGVASRNDAGANAYAGIGQFFTYSGSGTATVSINIDVVDTDADLDWAITFLGYNQTGTATTLSGADVMNLGNTNNVSGGVNYAVTTLYKLDPQNIGSFSGDYTFDVTLDSNYEFYAIRIGAKSPDAADSFIINSVAIPEPATVGMLGLGALVTLLIRRMKR